MTTTMTMTTLATNTNAATFSSFSSNAHKKLPKTPTTTMKRRRRVLMMMKTKAHAEEEEKKIPPHDNNNNKRKDYFPSRRTDYRWKRRCALPRLWLWPRRRLSCPSLGTQTSSPRARRSRWKSAQRRYASKRKRERERKNVFLYYFFLFASVFRVLPALLVFCPLYVHHSPHALSFFIR